MSDSHTQVMSSPAAVLHRAAAVHRLAVGLLFFFQGLCFASWASRIPTIQQGLKISEAGLGAVLLALPVGSLLSLSFSGRLIASRGSRWVALLALSVYPVGLAAIGFSSSIPLLVAALVLFGATGNLSNIAINTQAVLVEAAYGRSIMASFHGLWSLAGFTAAGIGAYFIGRAITPALHFLVIAAALLLGLLACAAFLVRDGKTAAVHKQPLFSRPPPALLKLGLLALCCMTCEGAMFDWSGVYFQNVVQPPKDWLGAGYTAFMCAMAGGRFMADWFTNRFRFRTTITTSGVLIAGGLLLAVLFPSLLLATAGFLLVGFGVSSVVPLVYSQAGKTNGVEPGKALTAVSSVGFLGFLVGPPLIGLVAGATSLRISFLLVAIIGLLLVLLVRKTATGRP